jgi:hypothetical protein
MMMHNERKLKNFSVFLKLMFDVILQNRFGVGKNFDGVFTVVQGNIKVKSLAVGDRKENKRCDDEDE